MIGDTDASPTVLLIEDEESVRNVIRRTLELGGIRVLSAADGTEAIALARALAPGESVDVIISDVILPAPPLGEVLERLREFIDSPSLILMSGYPREQIAARMPDWPNEYLQKPFPITLLRDKVKEAAAEHRRATR
ncbi:MAG: response regulator [Longimicrobiales bacterium]